MYNGEKSDLCIEVTVKGRSATALQGALDLSAGHHKSVEAYAEKDEWLVFYWAMPSDGAAKRLSKLPFKTAANSKFIKEFIVQWLTEAQYPPEPDHDGSNGEGFEFTNTERSGWSYEAFRVRPAWMEYHK